MESDTKTRSGGMVGYLTIGAAALSVAALLLLLCSGFGAKVGLWHFRTGFALLKYAAYLGLVSALLALVVVILSLKARRLAGASVALLALLCGLAAAAVPYSWQLKAKKFPRIHDISTDLDNPPKFVAVAPLRGGAVDHGGAAVAVQQLSGYPDLKTLVLSIPMERAFQAALETARGMGWQIVAQVPAEGRIEATDTTFWFGFKDDIVVRVYPAGGRSLIDVRSVSRVGISDVGTNAQRIRAYLAKLPQSAR